MTLVPQIKYTLPSYLASALICNNWDTLNLDEASELVGWLEDKILEHGGLFDAVSFDDCGGSDCHDYTPLSGVMCNCHEFGFYVNKV